MLENRVNVLRHDGMQFKVRDAGPRAGDVVVLLHGFPQDSRCWDTVAATLHQSGLRTLAPDQRGYSPGASPSSVSAYRVEALASDVLRLLDVAGVQRAHVVGHDWGGALAWHLAAHHRDRVASLTVLSTPHPRALTWSLPRSTQALRSWYTVAVQVPVLPELLLVRTLAPALRMSGLPEATTQRYAARLASTSSLHGPLNWYRASGRHPTQLMAALRHEGDDDTIHVPTTYLWGRRDPALGRAAAERTETYVQGEYRFVELDAGHWLPELEPDTVAREIAHRVWATTTSAQGGA